MTARDRPLHTIVLLDGFRVKSQDFHTTVRGRPVSTVYQHCQSFPSRFNVPESRQTLLSNFLSFFSHNGCPARTDMATFRLISLKAIAEHEAQEYTHLHTTQPVFQDLP